MTNEKVYETVLINENEATIIGTVKKTEDENNFFWVETKRKSGAVDTIRCRTPLFSLEEGDRVEIRGRLRSMRIHKATHRDKLILYIEVLFIEVLSSKDTEDRNEITLYGYLSKNGYVRKTPLGRDIMDFFVCPQVATLDNGKLITDTIPCICWGGNAERGKDFAKKNVLVKVSGRLQERHYEKTLVSGEVVDRLLHELSCNDVYYYD